MTWTHLVLVDKLIEGQARSFELDGEALLAYRFAANQVAVVEDRCSHDGAPLGDSPVEGGEIECPRHGARFDLRSGEVRRAPAFAPLLVYPTRISAAGEVEVDLDGAE